MRRHLTSLLCTMLLAACAKPPGLAPGHAADFNACQGDVERDPKADSLRKRLDMIDSCMAAKGWKPTTGCKYQENEGTRFCEYAR
jgi:hypothetical protein